MSTSTKPTTLDCPQKNGWVSVRLIDEHGEGIPYSGLPYRLHDSRGRIFEGHLDKDGFTKIEGIYSGPSVLDLAFNDSGELDPWYKSLAIRKAFKLPLTTIQVAAEQSPAGPRRTDGKTYLAEARATAEKARFARVEVSDFVELSKHLPDPDATWSPKPSAMLKQNAGLAKDQPGIALKPNQHHVLEVKALRAYSPLLSLNHDFCALNAYHLAVMSAFVYAPFGKPTTGKRYESSAPPYELAGSIGNVLREQLGHLIKPDRFNEAKYNLLYEEVPYSKRLEVMPHDPDYYAAEAAEDWANPEDVHFLYDKDTETQAFITHNDKLVLISVRGTQGRSDILRDLDARQVRYEEGEGQAHRGFYNAFQATKTFVNRYLDAFYTGEQTIIISGHSLGGAIALLLAEWLRRLPSQPKVILYTFGSPRAGDSAFAQGAAALTHHRIVNHNDPVPAVPFPWMDAEWKLALPGTIALFSSPIIGIALLLGGLLNLRGDPYQHHGDQRHLMPRKPEGGSEVAILWQPGCASIDEQVCASFAGSVDLHDDMPKRKSLLGQAFSAAEHSSDAGYSRGLLTTLLRWNASVESRGGALFTTSEMQDIHNQVELVEQQLASWQPRSFLEFRKEVRLRHDRRFYGKTDLELRQLYDEGITLARELSSQQRKELARTKERLLNQAMRPLTSTDVFGEHSQNPELEKLVSEWRAIDANAQAELLAKISTTPSKVYA